MRRIILDTNIYGLIAVDEERESIRNGLMNSGIVVYGNPIIRRELRMIPCGVVDNINLRSDVLGLYREVTKEKETSAGKRELDLSEIYYKVYKEQGGTTSKAKMGNDFIIVASASLHGLDIVVSEDNATMLSELSRRAYSAVNAALKIKVPRFIGYEEFKKEIKK